METEKRLAASKGRITHSPARQGGETNGIPYYHTLRADTSHMSAILFDITRPRISGSNWPTSEASLDIPLTNWRDRRFEDGLWDDIRIVDGIHQAESTCDSIWPRQYSGSHSSVDAMPNFRGDGWESREGSRKYGGYSK